jgi:hypothetical protein
MSLFRDRTRASSRPSTRRDPLLTLDSNLHLVTSFRDSMKGHNGVAPWESLFSEITMSAAMRQRLSDVFLYIHLEYTPVCRPVPLCSMSMPLGTGVTSMSRRSIQRSHRSLWTKAISANIHFHDTLNTAHATSRTSHHSHDPELRKLGFHIGIHTVALISCPGDSVEVGRNAVPISCTYRPLLIYWPECQSQYTQGEVVKRSIC